MAAPRKIDWERIEPDWRAGIKSVLQIAADYEEATEQKVSHTAINKHFKQLGVPRDLAAKIRAKADAIVSASMVSGKVSIETTVRDAEIIDVSAIVLANVKLSQRKDIQRSRALATALLEELEQMTGSREVFKKLGEILSGDDEDGNALVVDKLMDAFHKTVSHPGRVESMKKLADTIRVLISLEREAYGIDGDGKGNGTGILEAAIRRVVESDR